MINAIAKDKNLIILPLVLIISLLLSCDNNIERNTERKDNLQPLINISEQALSFDKNGGSVKIQLFATRNWVAKIPASIDWVQISPSSAEASEEEPNTVDINVQNNKGIPRIAIIEFSIGSKSQTLTIRQEGQHVITLSENALNFERIGECKKVKVFATKDWRAIIPSSVDWLSVNPYHKIVSENDTSIVEITVTENLGLDRTTTIQFSIESEVKTMTINQKGRALIYANDFDKKEATKTFGTGSSWPNLDQFEGWKNEQGKGAGNVTYVFNGMSVRANSGSNSNYSDYQGSGKNNLFFGSKAYFIVQDIALNGNTNIALSFGTVKNSQDNGSIFTNSEFHIYLSSDTKKWIELKDYTFAGGQTQRRWNVASATFSVPAGTKKLSICFDVDAATAYSLDDLTLSVAGAEGASIDFSKGVEKDFGVSSGGEDDPSKVQQITCAEYIAKADPNTTYRLVGKVTSTVNTTYCSFDMSDGSATVTVWTVKNKDEWKNVVRQGGIVTVRGKYDAYGSGENIKHEMVDAYIENFETNDEKYLRLAAYTMDVSAASTSAVFQVYSNVSWKVTTDNKDYKVTNPNGTGDASVTITFPKNTGEPKIIKATVTPSNSSLEPKTLIINHKKQ